MERVAARAGLGKAALYRRWPSKAAMVADVLYALGVTITEVPDTGSLEGDVQALLRSFRRVLRPPLLRRIVPDLQAQRARSLHGRAPGARADPDRARHLPGAS